MIVSASLLSADLLNLEKEIHLLSEAGVNCLHIDVMDGHFVPNIAFGIDIIKRISNVSDMPINVHLMIENPDKFIDVVAYSNVNYIIIHTEGYRNVEKTLEKIKNSGVEAGIAINPQTQVNDISRYFYMVDMALVMGVYPGFGGQALIPSTIDKIRQIKSQHKNITVGIDGGINDKTVSLANKAEADILVIGSYLFENYSGDKLSSMKEKLKILCQRD